MGDAVHPHEWCIYWGVLDASPQDQEHLCGEIRRIGWPDPPLQVAKDRGVVVPEQLVEALLRRHLPTAVEAQFT
jgi:hypothetical protein